MTHADLVKRAGQWLGGTCKCTVVLTEFTAATAEIPDAIGWRWGFYPWSILVECKTNRADFRRDATKPTRNGAAGPGQERWYMAPEGVLRPEDIPDDWGLAEVRGRRVVRVVTPERSTLDDGLKCQAALDPQRTLREMPLLLSVVRRATAGLGVDVLRRHLMVVDDGEAGADV